MAELFGFSCSNLSFDSNIVSCLGNDGTLFGALISRKIEPSSKLYNSATLFRLSIPPIDKTPNIFSNNNLLERESEELKDDDDDISLVTKYDNIPKEVIYRIEPLNRKIITECSKDELSKILRLEFAKNEEICDFEFIKHSFNALLGYSSEIYSIKCNGKLFSGRFKKSVYQFYQEIQFSYLLQIYLDHLVKFYASKSKHPIDSCMLNYSMIANAVETMLCMYKSSMSSLIVAFNYNKIFELSSILIWTSSLRRYLILVFQIVASDDLRSCMLQYLVSKSNESFDSFQDVIVSVLSDNVISIALSDMWRTCSELANTSYLLCHRYEYRFYSPNNTCSLQSRDMSFERGRLLIARFFFKCLSHSFLFKLRESLFQFHHYHNNDISSDKLVSPEVSQELNELSCIVRFKQCTDWISTRLQLFMNQQTRLNIFSAFNNVKSVNENEIINTFSVSKYLIDLCYDGEISLFIPYTDDDMSILYNSTGVVRKKVDMVQSMMEAVFDHRSENNESSASIFNNQRKLSTNRCKEERLTIVAKSSNKNNLDSKEILVDETVAANPTPAVTPQTADTKHRQPESIQAKSTTPSETNQPDVSINIGPHHSITNIVGYEKFISSDSFELAKSKILSTYMDMMSSVDKKRDELAWRRKRINSLRSCRERLIEQRFEDVSYWNKMVSSAQPLVTSDEPKVISVTKNRFISNIPSSPSQHANESVSIGQISVPDSSIQTTKVIHIENTLIIQTDEVTSDDLSASMVAGNSQNISSEEIVIVSTDVDHAQSQSSDDKVTSELLRRNPATTDTQLLTPEDITNETDSINRSSPIQASTSVTKNSRTSNELKLTLTTQQSQNSRQINPSIKPVPKAKVNMNQKLPQKLEAFPSFLFASAQILDKNRHQEVERSETMIARINASFSQSLLILAEQENLCDLTSTTEGCENEINTSMNPSLEVMIENSLMPLLHWQCKLFDMAVLLSIFEESNGNLMGHLDFVYDTFLLSNTSTFMKQYVDSIVSASCFTSKSTISSSSSSSSSAYVRKTNRDIISTPWTNESLAMAFLHTSKLFNTRSPRSKFIQFLNKAKFSIVKSMETDNDNSKSTNKDVNRVLVSTENLSNLRIYFSIDFPISLFISERTMLIISYATRRIMEMMQLTYAITVIWQESRELTTAASRSRRNTYKVDKTNDIAIHLRNLSRNRDYAFLLVQQTIQSLFSFVWDRVHSSQLSLEEKLKQFDALGMDGNSVEEIAAIINNGFIDLLFSCFIEVKGDDIDSGLLQQVQTHTNRSRQRVSAVLEHILNICRSILRCIGDHLRISSMSLEECSLELRQQQANEISKLSTELCRKKSELILELKISQNHDSNAFLVFLGADL